MNDDHYECSTCGQRVYMGDLAAVMLHEHKGITDRVDLSNVAPGVRVDRGDSMKYRKKPVVIEAVQVRELVRAARDEWSALPPWMSEAYDRGDIVFSGDGISIKTLEGTMQGEIDDWIICGVKGELYPCKPDIFEETYELVDDEMPATTG